MLHSRRDAWCATLLSLLLVGLSLPVSAQKKKPALKKPPVRTPATVKGQGQLVGGVGRFGETYTLRNNFNFALLAAHYTVETIGNYDGTYPKDDEKLLVLDVAFKNASPADNYFDPSGMITAVDTKGTLFPVSGMALKSAGSKTATNLKPGQGIGQPALNDPLRMVVAVPNDARIVKLIFNQPRQNITEEVFRYYVAGATKAEAGEDGDPKNVITPLPEPLRDPSDPSGATALPVGKGVVGATTSDCASWWLRFRVNSIASVETVNGNPPEDGKRFVVANVTATYPVTAGRAADFNEVTAYYFPGTGASFAELSDADGEKYPVFETRKPTKDEPLADGKALKAGEEYTYRLVFAVPKDAALKTLTIGANNGRRWAFPVK